MIHDPYRHQTISSLSWSAGVWRTKLRSRPTWASTAHSGHRRQQPTSTISQPASADCTAMSADYVRPSGFLCGRPDGLELTTDWVSWFVCQFWWLQTHDVVRAMLVHSAQ